MLMALALVGMVLASTTKLAARPTPKDNKKGAEPQNFLRQTNAYSNIEFYYTNRGVLFNAGSGNAEGLFWPRGSGDSYIFGEGLWFATKKEIQGKRRKLCELGYNPNSGAGWYIEGEASQVGKTVGDDGSTPAAKYISYVGPRYDKTSGQYLSGSSSVVPSPYYAWPLWDTSATKTLKRNFYFGDYISDVTMRDANKLTTARGLDKIGKKALPAIISEEDIVNIYTDADPSNNPEYRPGQGYPFGLDVIEAIYSWSFGRYRDMIFLRQKVTNSSSDSLLDCWMAPAFDPDLGTACNNASQDDGNSYIDDSVVKANANPTYVAQLRQPYRSDPTKLNMGYQFRNPQVSCDGGAYGMVGFSFLESPVIDSVGNIIPNDDSAALRGYGPNSLFQKNQRGLSTFKNWILLNDPSTQDLRYDFVSSGRHEKWDNVYQDKRLLMATGPFTLPPHRSVETVVGITIARDSKTDPKTNLGALLLLSDFAHQVFGEVDSTLLSIKPDSSGKLDTTYGYFVNHFLSPVPPNIPIVKTQSLDRAVLVTWDSSAEHSFDPVSSLLSVPDTNIRKEATLPFMGYQLWRSTRSDHDSTIRPDGINPDVMLGDWHLYDFRSDSVFDSKGHFNHIHYTRLNSTPHPIPHSYLDVGDDNHDGILTGTEGLYNGVKYYYYLIAYDEYDSVNHTGPLYTAIVNNKNAVVGEPSKPAYLTTFNGDTASNIAGSCLAGGLQDVRLDIVDTGRFAQLFTNDVIYVSFQPRWNEYAHYPELVHNQSPLFLLVDISDSVNKINNNHTTMASPYYFPQTQLGAITLHVNGTVNCDSTFTSQFSTDNSLFAPNQTVGQAFHVLADISFEQLCSPYRLKSVSVSGQGDPQILRLSQRTNFGSANDPNQNIYNLPGDSVQRPPITLNQKTLVLIGHNQGDVITRGDTTYTLDTLIKSSGDTGTFISRKPQYHYTAKSTRPAFIGGLGEASYDVKFGNTMPSPIPIQMPGGAITPTVMPITVSLSNCPAAVLRHVKDSLNELMYEVDGRYYSDVLFQAPDSLPFPKYDDPDTMRVPQPGYYEVDAWHYYDPAAFDAVHINAQPAFQNAAQTSNGTTGPYYFPLLEDSSNADAQHNHHLVVHRLKVGGAELIFNAPEIADRATTGDTIAGTGSHVNPHTKDFVPGDKVTLSFTGIAKNLPFPNAQFRIVTEHGANTDLSNSSNYTSSILDQVQVVPNPYIVTHIGQTSPDNAKLYFTRLPPRATIEIYALDGTLINTLEHIGYTTNSNGSTSLTDRSSVEEWNLLTSGKQRVGSQVLFARVIAKDPSTNAEIAETVTKFAVIVPTSGHINNIK